MPVPRKEIEKTTLLVFISSFSTFQFELMNKVSTYFRESYRELLEKVSWPTWTQLQQSVVIVLVATLFITALVWAMDIVASRAVTLIYSLFN